MHNPNLDMVVPLASQPRQGPQLPRFVRGVMVQDDAHLLSLLAAEREGERAAWAWKEAAQASAQVSRRTHLERYLAAGGTHHGFCMRYVVDPEGRLHYL